jgi:hypothetical protein
MVQIKSVEVFIFFSIDVRSAKSMLCYMKKKIKKINIMAWYWD